MQLFQMLRNQRAWKSYARQASTRFSQRTNRPVPEIMIKQDRKCKTFHRDAV
jgi:hypothetical protein